MTFDAVPRAGPEAPRPSRVKDGPLLILRGPEYLSAWIEQTESFARQLGCAAELQEHDGSVDPARAETTGDFLRKIRTDTAVHIIVATIGSPIYAYARVLGYNSICGKNPSSLYKYVQTAASRMSLVHKGKQSAEEAAKIMSEWQHASPDFYPRQVRFDGAIEWLEKMIRRRYACGDDTMTPAVQVMDCVAKTKGSSGGHKRDAPAPDTHDNHEDAYPTPSPTGTGASRSSPKRRFTEELRRIQSDTKAEPESGPFEIRSFGGLPKQQIPRPKS